MAELLSLARQRLEDWQIWVNPDCGLKTRKWEKKLGPHYRIWSPQHGCSGSSRRRPRHEHVRPLIGSTSSLG